MPHSVAHSVWSFKINRTYGVYWEQSQHALLFFLLFINPIQGKGQVRNVQVFFGGGHGIHGKQPPRQQHDVMLEEGRYAFSYHHGRQACASSPHLAQK